MAHVCLNGKKFPVQLDDLKNAHIKVTGDVENLLVSNCIVTVYGDVTDLHSSGTVHVRGTTGHITATSGSIFLKDDAYKVSASSQHVSIEGNVQNIDSVHGNIFVQQSLQYADTVHKNIHAKRAWQKPDPETTTVPSPPQEHAALSNPLEKMRKLVRMTFGTVAQDIPEEISIAYKKFEVLYKPQHRLCVHEQFLNVFDFSSCKYDERVAWFIEHITDCSCQNLQAPRYTDEVLVNNRTVKGSRLEFSASKDVTLRLIVDGNVQKLDTRNSTTYIEQNVARVEVPSGNVFAHGYVTYADAVHGNIDVSGSVQVVKTTHGNVDVNGHASKARTVHGRITAGSILHASSVHGNIQKLSSSMTEVRAEQEQRSVQLQKEILRQKQELEDQKYRYLVGQTYRNISKVHSARRKKYAYREDMLHNYKDVLVNYSDEVLYNRHRQTSRIRSTESKYRVPQQTRTERFVEMLRKLCGAPELDNFSYNN